MKIDVGDDVELRVIHRGVGGITEGDINLAIADNVIVLGFNVRAEGKATELANREGVEIRYYTVIYQAIEEIEEALKGLLKPEFEEVELGRAEVREVFRSSRFGIDRRLPRAWAGSSAATPGRRLLRDNVVVAENLSISSLRRFKDDVVEVRDGLRVWSHARATTTTSRSATSSRPSRCGRSPARDASGRRVSRGPFRRANHVRRSVGVGRPARGRPLPEGEAVGGAARRRRAAATVRGGRRRGRATSTCTGERCIGVSCVGCRPRPRHGGARPLRASRRRASRAGAALGPVQRIASGRETTSGRRAEMVDHARARRLAKRISQIVA